MAIQHKKVTHEIISLKNVSGVCEQNKTIVKRPFKKTSSKKERKKKKKKVSKVEIEQSERKKIVVDENKYVYVSNRVGASVFVFVCKI